MSRLVGAAMIGALALALSACSSSGSSGSPGSATSSEKGGAPSSSSGDTGKPIIIGAAVAKSGGFELYDNPQIAGMQFAIDQINAAGGINGRKLKIITSDTKTDPAQIQSAAQDVLSKGADVVVTTPDYDFGAPAAIAASKADKVSLGGAGAPEYALQGLGPLHFNVYQGTPTEGVTLAQFAYNTKHWRHPYLLVDTSIAYSKSLCTEFEKSWTALAGAGSIVGKDTFVNSDPSVANQVSKVRAASSADFVVMCSYPPGGASAIRQLRTANVNLPILGGAGFDGTFWNKAIPNLSDFYNAAMASSAGDDTHPAINDFIKNVKFQGSASYALFGYEIIETLKYGIAKAGTTEGKALAAAIETMKAASFLVGPTTYSATCHAPVDRPMAMVQVTNGKAKLAGYITPTGVPRTAC